jgi:hypothetical protein
MTGTLSSEVNDLFLSRINDYRLNALYQSSGSVAFGTYLEPWLLDATVEFEICNQDLTYIPSTSTDEGYFNQTLNLKNKIILSRIMVKYWLKKEVQDILQMNNLVQDHDFKTFSQAQNLDSKKSYLVVVQEEISQLLVDYDYKNNDWASWKNQEFG